jgi:molecular chaperone GrpE
MIEIIDGNKENAEAAGAAETEEVKISPEADTEDTEESPEAGAAEETAEAGTEAEAEEVPEDAEEPADEDTAEAPQAGEGTGEAAEPQGKEKGGFFRRGKNKELEALKEKNAALEDRVKRQMAEFDNYRKRTEKEKSEMFSMGERSLAEKILPTIDNFERGLVAVPENEKGSAFAMGMEAIYRQFLDQLSAVGIKQIDAVGKEFDPNFHNAVMQVETEEFESGIVAQEFQQGYMYHDTVLRHSMVGVAK